MSELGPDGYQPPREWVDKTGIDFVDLQEGCKPRYGRVDLRTGDERRVTLVSYPIIKTEDVPDKVEAGQLNRLIYRVRYRDFEVDGEIKGREGEVEVSGIDDDTRLQSALIQLLGNDETNKEPQLKEAG